MSQGRTVEGSEDKLHLIIPNSSAAFLIIAYFLFQQPIYAQSDQSHEDMLQKASDDIAKAKQSGVTLGTVSILSHNSYTDASGVFHVVGEVYNDMAPDIASSWLGPVTITIWEFL